MDRGVGKKWVVVSLTEFAFRLVQRKDESRTVPEGDENIVQRWEVPVLLTPLDWGVVTRLE